MKKKSYQMPKNPGLTFNMKIQWAMDVSYVWWNGEKNRIEMEAKRNVIREMCDRKGHNLLGEIIWMMKLKTLELVDMDKLEIIRTLKVKPHVNLVEGDTVNMSWQLFIEECFPTDDVEVKDYRRER